MRFRQAAGLLAPITFALPVFAAPNRTPAATPVPKGSAAHYETAVQPLLAARCGGCHLGPLVRGGLSVADAGHLRAGGHGGPAVQPGRPEESLLYRVLAEGRMPQGGRRFSPRELELVANWIRDGARTRATPGGHWAYQPLPVVSTAPAIDAMLQHRLRRLGLALSPEAAKRDLLRRLSFSLTGLPPTPSELEEFERDGSPEAYARQVERLLASEHYGERWARHWLDPAGYADSEGVLQEDRLRPNAWMYRDSVIRALNADKPLDEFIREQIAGDELVHYKTVPRFTPQIIDTLALTGFLRTPVDATRADFNARQYGEYQYRMVNDLQTILSSSLLGLTIQCARCHNHKYEPITQKDYYAFQAIFTGAVRPRGAILPSADRQIVAATAAEQAQAVRTNGEVDAALREIAKREEELTRARQAKSIQDGERPTDPAERIALAAAAGRPDGARSPAEKQLIEKLKSLIPSKETLLKADPEFARQMQSLLDERQSQEKRRIQLTSIRAFYDVDAAPPPTPLLARGEWLKPVEPVEPGVPAFLSRQTDLLVAAGRTGKAVNVKKGQFLSPWDMRHAVEKVLSTGNKRVMLTERGSSFGYGNLVVDMRSYEIMRGFGVPVIHDATHCVQLPGGNGATTGGQREYVPALARAAAAVGVDGVFFETHPDPDKALSDGPNSLRLADVPAFLRDVVRVDALVKE